MRSVPFRDDLMVKVPSSLVMTPPLLPWKRTEAPATGSPFSWSTLPVRLIVWAVAFWHGMPRANARKSIRSMLLIAEFLVVKMNAGSFSNLSESPVGMFMVFTQFYTDINSDATQAYCSGNEFDAKGTIA